MVWDRLHPDSFPPAKSAEIFIKILTPRCRSFLHWTNDPSPGEVLQYFQPALPYSWFYIFMHIWFFSVNSVVVRLYKCGPGTICKSVPVVSHKFKSGLSVSKEIECNLRPISRTFERQWVKCKFLFPPSAETVQLLHSCPWMRLLVNGLGQSIETGLWFT